MDRIEVKTWGKYVKMVWSLECAEEIIECAIRIDMTTGWSNKN